AGQELSTREICHDPSLCGGRRRRRPAALRSQAAGRMTDRRSAAELTARDQSSAARLDTVDTIVLVEGISDGIAIQTLAARFGRDLANERVSIMPIGGATNIRRSIEQISRERLDCTLAGLCDEREARFFRAALDDVFVCVSDLEDELIRALGAPAV